MASLHSLPTVAAVLTAQSFFGIPRWVLVGIGLAATATAIVATLFILGETFVEEGSPPGEGSGGEPVRRGEIRRYLEAIGERYVENALVEGQEVAFHLPEREVVLTFDAHVFFAFEDSGMHAVLCEHEMRGLHLGSRLPFETPTIEVDDGVGADVSAAFATLGVPTDAEPDAIRRAYRERVKETHPDQGGSQAAFSAVQEAYAVASDHAERPSRERSSVARR